MGVTLERVQNKFACIIGELCSEPVVLSQFAIWLDLRLAEYKAKGAISLECSGEHPDPSWLQGHIPPPPPTPSRVKPRLTTPSRSFPSRPRKHHTPSKIVSHTQIRSATRTPSASVVVVKEEPTEYVEELGVFPVSLHKHDNWRKRSATQTLAKDDEYIHVESDNGLVLDQSGASLISSSTPKARKVEGIIPEVSLHSEEQETESLISIITGEADDSKLENSNSQFSNEETEDDRGGDNSAMSFSAMPSTSQADGDVLGQFPDTDGADTSNAGKAADQAGIDLSSDSCLWKGDPVELQENFVSGVDLKNFTAGLASFNFGTPGSRKAARAYTESDVQKALSVIRSGEMTHGNASKKYNIPWSTLRNRLLAPKRTPKNEKYRQWSMEDMDKAIEEVKSGASTLTQASVKFSIPRSTLERRVSNYLKVEIDPNYTPI